MEQALRDMIASVRNVQLDATLLPTHDPVLELPFDHPIWQHTTNVWDALQGLRSALESQLTEITGEES